MTTLEVFLTAMRWVHAIATVAWLGGGLFYLLVLSPATRGTMLDESWRELSPRVGAAFGELTRLSIVALTISGAFLMADRLTSSVASIPYVSVLAVKVALSLWVFAIAWGLSRSPRKSATLGPSPTTGSTGLRFTAYLAARATEIRQLLYQPTLIVFLGAGIVLLSDTLKVMAESTLGYR